MNVISQMIENRYQPLVAFDAIRKLIRNKEDTSQVFRLLVAMRGMSFVRNVKRFAKTPTEPVTAPALRRRLTSRPSERSLARPVVPTS